MKFWMGRAESSVVRPTHTATCFTVDMALESKKASARHTLGLFFWGPKKPKRRRRSARGPFRAAAGFPRSFQKVAWIAPANKLVFFFPRVFLIGEAARRQNTFRS